MLPLERQEKIIELLMEKKVMKMQELTKLLSISIDTLRRDLQPLIKQGRVKKIYGGIELIDSAFTELPMGERMVSQLQEKRAIAHLCSTQIGDGDCIYLDSGSTTYQIAKYIKNKKNITVITNSLPIVLELLHSEIDVIIVGGKIRKEEHSIYSHDHLFQFHPFNIEKAFICASGITIEKGISDYNLEEAITRKKMIDLANEVYVACDSSKFGKDVRISIAPLDCINHIVTDENIANPFIREFAKLPTKLLIAKLTDHSENVTSQRKTAPVGGLAN